MWSFKTLFYLLLHFDLYAPWHFSLHFMPLIKQIHFLDLHIEFLEHVQCAALSIETKGCFIFITIGFLIFGKFIFVYCLVHFFQDQIHSNFWMTVCNPYMAYNVAMDTKNFIYLFCMVYNFFCVKRKPCLFLGVNVFLILISLFL